MRAPRLRPGSSRGRGGPSSGCLSPGSAHPTCRRHLLRPQSRSQRSWMTWSDCLDPPRGPRPRHAGARPLRSPCPSGTRSLAPVPGFSLWRLGPGGLETVENVVPAAPLALPACLGAQACPSCSTPTSGRDRAWDPPPTPSLPRRASPPAGAAEQPVPAPRLSGAGRRAPCGGCMAPRAARSLR